MLMRLAISGLSPKLSLSKGRRWSLEAITPPLHYLSSHHRSRPRTLKRIAAQALSTKKNLSHLFTLIYFNYERRIKGGFESRVGVFQGFTSSDSRREEP